MKLVCYYSNYTKLQSFEIGKVLVTEPLIKIEFIKINIKLKFNTIYNFFLKFSEGNNYAK